MNSNLQNSISWETGEYPCSYIDGLVANLEYRIFPDMTAQEYGELLQRGWRRFGINFFRPVCHACNRCESLRVDVNNFQPSRSQRRAIKRNRHIRWHVQNPECTDAHLQLFRAWHTDMHRKKGWPLHEELESEYVETLIDAQGDFAREIQYWDDGRLIGVGLIDETPAGLSSVYFYHEPEWRKLGPGVFSVICEIDYARSRGLSYLYLGYRVNACPSMAYKSQYNPHELLDHFVEDRESPLWIQSGDR